MRAASSAEDRRILQVVRAADGSVMAKDVCTAGL